MISGKNSWTPLLLSTVFAVAAGMAIVSPPHLTATAPVIPVHETVAPVTPHRETVDPNKAPYNAIAHMDLEGQQAATLEFGPSSSQVVVSAAHVFNSISYGDDTHASYEDDRGNKANIVAIYLPKNYNATSDAEDHGMYADKVIVVLDRPIPGAGHFNFHTVDVPTLKPHPVNKDETEFKASAPLRVTQAGYPAEMPHMSANLGGALIGVERMPQDPSIYLLHHDLDIIPGDSGSPVWDQDGMVGIAQSNLYATPITPAFIDAYNRVVEQTAAHPPAVQSTPPKVQIYRMAM